MLKSLAPKRMVQGVEVQKDSNESRRVSRCSKTYAQQVRAGNFSSTQFGCQNVGSG